MSTLNRALEICAIAFSGVTDKSNEPYMLHCLYVMHGADGMSDEVRIAYLLHDLLEDCPEWTEDRLYEEGFTKLTIDIIVAMTHEEGESYENYIKRVSMNPMAVIGKRRDLRHNMDITRLKGVRQKDFERLVKYASAYHYLSKF